MNSLEEGDIYWSFHDNKGHNCVQKDKTTTYTGTLGAKDLLIPLENATKFHNDLLTIRSV
jgi:hypothetical protein